MTDDHDSPNVVAADEAVKTYDALCARFPDVMAHGIAAIVEPLRAEIERLRVAVAIDQDPLRRLVAQWRAKAAGPFHPFVRQSYDNCADELEALIAALPSSETDPQTADALNLLATLLLPCEGADDHSWRKCKHCTAMHGLEMRFPVTMRLMEHLQSLALRPSQEEATQTGWQPMSTAPKDGTAVIVSVGEGVWNTVGEAYWSREIRYVEGSGRCDEPAGWRWSSSGRKSGMLNREPAAWQPLPTAPQTGQEQK
jgi:hypothetical protein